MSNTLDISAKSRHFRALISAAALSATAPLAGCALLYDYSDLEPPEADGGQGGQGGMGGSGGAGGALEPCEPGEMRSCYDGPPGTKDVGMCQGGIQTCLMDGTGYGPCEAQVLPQTESCKTPQDESCDGSLDDGPPECPGSVLWSDHITGMGLQIPVASAVDANGNALVTGFIEKTAMVGGKQLSSVAETDVFLAKYAPDGSTMWSYRFGGAEEQEARALAVDAIGNTIVVGSFSGSIDFGGAGGPLSSAGLTDAFIAKIDPNGMVVWRKQLGDDKAQYATGVAVDAAGNAIVVGRFEGTIATAPGILHENTGAMSVFAVKLDPNGDRLWSAPFGDAGAQGAEAVAVDMQGNALVAGWFEGSIDFGDGPKSIVGGSDAFLAKFDPMGGVVWSKQLGGPGDQRAMAVAADKLGNAVVTGHFMGLIDLGGQAHPPVGAEDMFIAKYSDAGVFSWKLILGSSFDDRGLGVATDSQNNILVSGVISGPPDFGDFMVATGGGLDAFLAKMTPEGAPIWLKTAGDGADQQGTSVAAAKGDDVIWTGHFLGQISLGSGEYSTVDLNDGFVARLLQ